jgi:DNA-binding transcriptional LysR family regulator
LILTDQFANIVEEGIDLAVRIGHLPDSGMVARRLATVRRVLCASPGYLERYGTPRAPDDLTAHNCMQFSALSPSSYWELRDGGKARQIRVQGTFRSNHGASMIDAARSGLGVVMALSYQVQEYVERGELRVLLQQFEPTPLPVHAVLPSSRMQPARVRALTELLVHRLNKKDLSRLVQRKPHTSSRK